MYVYAHTKNVFFASSVMVIPSKLAIEEVNFYDVVTIVYFPHASSRSYRNFYDTQRTTVNVREGRLRK